MSVTELFYGCGKTHTRPILPNVTLGPSCFCHLSREDVNSSYSVVRYEMPLHRFTGRFYIVSQAERLSVLPKLELVSGLKLSG